jgi:hypothetical protein
MPPEVLSQVKRPDLTLHSVLTEEKDYVRILRAGPDYNCHLTDARGVAESQGRLNGGHKARELYDAIKRGGGADRTLALPHVPSRADEECEVSFVSTTDADGPWERLCKPSVGMPLNYPIRVHMQVAYQSLDILSHVLPPARGLEGFEPCLSMRPPLLSSEVARGIDASRYPA